MDDDEEEKNPCAWNYLFLIEKVRVVCGLLNRVYIKKKIIFF